MSTHSSSLAQRAQGIPRSFLAFLGVLTLACTLLLPGTSAHAAEPAGCGAGTLSTPFSKWSDSNLYSLVPGGSFETGAPAWTLSGGAAVAPGSEPWGATGTLGSFSLSIPKGGSARSPFICVTPADRTFRFFDRAEAAGATLTASVIYKTLTGTVTVPQGKLTPTSGWAPSAILHTGAALAAVINGGTVYLSFQFTSAGAGVRVDDVFLDPRHH